MADKPSKITTIGAMQIVSGVLNLAIVPCVASNVLVLVGGTCTGIITLGMCPFGMLCGILPWLLTPIAIFEIVAGIMVLVNEKPPMQLSKIAAYVEVASVLVGGLVGAVVGGVVLMLSNDPEIAAYIEDQELV